MALLVFGVFGEEGLVVRERFDCWDGGSCVSRRYVGKAEIG